MTYMGKKIYSHDMEVEVEFTEDVTKKMQWCKSPLCTQYPTCCRAFYACEYEETFGTVKHEPNMRKYSRPKPGTSVYCRDMPLGYCQRLVDTTDMKCPHCGQSIKGE